MNTKQTYAAPECEMVSYLETTFLCQSGDATLNPLIDDPDTIIWNSL